MVLQVLCLGLMCFSESIATEVQLITILIPIRHDRMCSGSKVWSAKQAGSYSGRAASVSKSGEDKLRKRPAETAMKPSSVVNVKSVGRDSFTKPLLLN